MLASLILIAVCAHVGSVPISHIFPKDCGKRVIPPKRSGRIVNGRYADFAEFPWMVSIQDRTGLATCGAAIVHSRFLITAAHCFDHVYDPSQIVLELGEHDLDHDREELPSLSMNVSSILIHPKYNKTDLRKGYDLALLKTEVPIQFDRHIQPICVPLSKKDLKNSGKMAMLAGWGQLFYKGKYAAILRKVALPILPGKICEKMFPNVPSRMKGMTADDMFICAGYRKGKRSACRGDSGGPLQIRGSRGRSFIIGVTSFSHPYCAAQNNPAMYIRVTSFIEWMEETMYKNT